MVFQTIAAAVLLAATAAQAQTRVLCIGDSITQGGGQPGEYTYRVPLQAMLRDVDFIGTRRHGLTSIRWPDGFDPDHEGYYGATTEQVRSQLVGSLPHLPAPDVALVYLGWNDAWLQTVHPLAAIVRMLRARNPKVRVYIGLLALDSLRGRHTRFVVEGMVGRMSTPESPVVAVHHPLGMGDTFDGAHPNQSGQAKMAAAWYAAINGSPQ